MGKTVKVNHKTEKGNPDKLFCRIDDSRVFSTDPSKSCKTFCCVCDQVINLSGLRKHIKTRHQMTLTEYKAMYGNPRSQIIQVVFHRCAFCRKHVLLDTEDMSKHLKKAHQTSYKDYLGRYMMKEQKTLPRKAATIIKNVEKKMEPLLVVIRCDECPQTF